MERELRFSLERKAGAELAHEGARKHRRACARIDEARRLQEAAGAGRVHDVITVVRTIGQIEALKHQLQIVALCKMDALTNSRVQLEEIVTAQSIVTGLMT